MCILKQNLEQISSYSSCGKPALVRKRVPAPLLSFLRHPPLDPDCPLVFKIFVSSPFFSVPPPFKVFQTVIPHPHKTPFFHNLTHQLSLHITGLNKYQMSDLTSSTIAFYQKSIFDFLYLLNFF